MKLTLVRSATLLLRFGDTCLLVDPMLAEAGAYPPVAGAADQRPNPLVPLPLPAEEVAGSADAVVVTHLHGDHFDQAAGELLSKDVPLLCQPGDEQALAERGFRDVRPVQEAASFDGLELVRTGGRHGHGELADQLGPVSGFVFRAPGEPSVYVAGDTVWCDDVAEVLSAHRPDVTVVNAAGARLGDSEPIVMTPADVAATARHAPWTRIVAVHLEALNHCPVTRAELRSAHPAVLVPEDGEELLFEPRPVA